TDGPLRLGIPNWPWRSLEPAVREAAENELERLRSLGHETVPVDTEALYEQGLKLADTFVLWEAPLEIKRYLKETESTVSYEEVVEGVASPDVVEFFEVAATQPVSEEAYRAALSALEQFREDFLALFDTHKLDFLLYPTVAAVAPVIGAESVLLDGQETSVFRTGIRNLETSSVVGTPALSVPIPTDGLPV